MRRGKDRGVVLVNVLVVVAIASGALVALMAAQDVAIQRGTRFSEMAQAMAVARGAEASAVIALRRDAREAPEEDHAGEAWARIGAEDRAIRDGRFAMTVEDMQGRFNINELEQGGLLARGAFGRLLSLLDLPVELADAAAAELRATGPATRLGALLSLSLEPGALELLAPHVTALPGRTDVNLNSAGPVVLMALLNNEITVGRLIRVRERQGFLGPDDLGRVQVLMPPGVGFASDNFRAVIDVTVGRTPHRRVVLLHRRTGPRGPEVIVTGRLVEKAGPT